MKLKHILLCSILGGAAVLGLSGCANIHRQVEKAVADSLPDLIGPAKKYSVDVSGSTFRLIKGKVSKLHIVGDDVRFKNGLTLSKLDVTVENIEFDTDSRKIKKAGKSVYSASVIDGELAGYLSRSYPDVPNIKIAVHSGTLNLSATPKVSGINVPVTAQAKVRVRNRSQLSLDILKASAARIPAPGFARNYIESKVNPVFDVSALGFDANIDRAALQPGRVTIYGTLDIMKMIK